MWGSGGIAPSFWTLAVDRGEWSAACPSHFSSRERVPGTLWIGGWVGPISGLDAVEYRIVSFTLPEMEPWVWKLF
jgi:hypothetical protein